MSETSSASAPNKNKPKLNSLFIGVGLAVAVLLLVASVFFLLRETRIVEPAALVIGESEVSQQVYDEYVALGEDRDLSKKQVQDIVVEYEKNKQMAEKFEIQLPAEYVEYVATNNTVAMTNQKPDSLAELERYNVAFAGRLAQSSGAGYGVFLYDVPTMKRPGADENAAVATAKQVASDFRAQIVDEKRGAVEVLNDVKDYNVQNGQAARTGYAFIVDREMTDYEREQEGFYSPAYMLNLVKDKDMGFTEVMTLGTENAFFLDILYRQKVVENLAADVQDAKDKMKVVIYDK